MPTARRRQDWRNRPARRRTRGQPQAPPREGRLPMTSRIRIHVRHCPVPAVLVRTKRPRTPTRAFICAADDYEASYDETTSTGGDESYSYESYESCAPLRLELRSPRDQLRTPRTYIKIGQRKPHTRTALISLGASQPCPASHSAHVARACSRHASCPHPASVWCTAQTRRRTHRPRPSRRSLPRPNQRRQIRSFRRFRPAGQRLPARAIIGGDATASRRVFLNLVAGVF